MTQSAIAILEQLVSFESISARPNHEITNYIRSYLEARGLTVTLSYDESGARANVFATIGPEVDGGLVLNGHTDVVPVDGQDWSSDPFTLTRRGDRLYGRGSVDMKGFLACVMASVPIFQAAALKRPVHVAFTFDEEIGGFGMPPLLADLADKPFRPALVIVGEPTEMNIVTGHKGGLEMRTEVTGRAVHSCDPSKGVNAISAAMQLIRKIEEIGARIAAEPAPTSAFQPPYGTFNIGTIEGGAARNATAGWCHFKWEFRPMPGTDPEPLIAEIKAYAEEVLLPPMQAVAPEAQIEIINEVFIPALHDTIAEPAAQFVSEVTGRNSRDVVSFGTDAGYFSNDGLSTVVCGPGTIDRAHAPDEYITVSELAQGMDFMERIAARLAQ